jgi:hypothetical protein
MLRAGAAIEQAANFTTLPQLLRTGL